MNEPAPAFPAVPRRSLSNYRECLFFSPAACHLWPAGHVPVSRSPRSRYWRRTAPRPDPGDGPSGGLV